MSQDITEYPENQPAFEKASGCSKNSAYTLAKQDIIEGFKSWRIWLLLAWQAIRLRYRRSYLGPFWITISMAVTIYSIGFLYGRLFKMNLNTYYPFLAAGILSWNLISTLIIESTTAFVESEGYIKQIKLPYTVHMLKLVCRNLIIFAHNAVVILPIVFIFHIDVRWSIFLLIPNLLLISTLGFVYGSLIAMISARYRDLSQIITSLVQVSFFLTPIMWKPNLLPAKYHYAVALNPFAQFVELIRAPLTGDTPSLYAYIASTILLLIGALITFLVFAKKRKHIIFWL